MRLLIVAVVVAGLGVHPPTARAAWFGTPQVDIVPPRGGAGNLSPLPGEPAWPVPRNRERNTALGRWLSPKPTAPPTMNSETVDENRGAWVEDDYFRFYTPNQFGMRFSMGPLD